MEIAKETYLGKEIECVIMSDDEYVTFKKRLDTYIKGTMTGFGFEHVTGSCAVCGNMYVNKDGEVFHVMTKKVGKDRRVVSVIETEAAVKLEDLPVWRLLALMARFNVDCLNHDVKTLCLHGLKNTIKIYREMYIDESLRLEFFAKNIMSVVDEITRFDEVRVLFEKQSDRMLMIG